MPARSSQHWWQLVMTQARTAGLVAAAVALGAGGALALANPQHLPTSATSAGTTATPSASVTTTDSPTGEPTAEPTPTLTDEDADAGTKPEADAATPTDPGTTDATEDSSEDASEDGGPAGLPSTGPPGASARGGGAAPAPVTCGDAVNHGAYVSSVARSASRTGEDAGPDHGKAVREAARSDCGKPKAAAGGTPGERDPSGAGSGRGHSDAPGKGHEKGRGKGHDEDS